MFRQTRLRLTIQSVSIVMLLSIFFTFAIYGLLLREVTRFSQLQRFRIERRISGIAGVAGRPVIATFPADYPPFIPTLQFNDPDLEQEVLQNIQLALLGVNGCVLVIASLLSYIVAGKALKPIQQLVEAQQEFMTAASHELRTPLTAIQLSSEVALRDKKLSLKDAKKVITDNLRELEHLQKLTENILQLQKAEQQAGLAAELIPIQEILHTALQQVTPLANAKSQRIQLEGSVLRVIQVKGSRPQLIELLVILLDNAIKYSPTKSVITVSGGLLGQMVNIEVCDQGPGIAEHELARVFEKFYRSDKSRSKQVPGFGLGLAIAQQIVSAHHGKLSASNIAGSGACFRIELPIA